MITVPGLSVKADWSVVHDRLLDDFPRVCDVLATTLPGTLLIVHEGESDADCWLRRIGDAILSRGTTRRGEESAAAALLPDDCRQ